MRHETTRSVGTSFLASMLLFGLLFLAEDGHGDSPVVCPQGGVGPVSVNNAQGTGTVCGIEVPTVQGQPSSPQAEAFLGIPYAEPPICSRRWAAPVKLGQFSLSPFPATKYGALCYQPTNLTPHPYMSEDCLTINVWRPPDTTSGQGLPVMVFIYGGAFYEGGTDAQLPTLPDGSGSLYDGAYLSAGTGEDVVVVTFNYRLGVLGFLASEENGLTGNYGLMDQQLALEWVHENIANFGGDPGKVTLFGESAGAMSVGLHLVSIPPTDYFRAAIMESNPLGIPFKTLEQAGDVFTAFAKLSGINCQDPALPCLRLKSARELVNNERMGSLLIRGDTNYPLGLHSSLFWTPVIGGALLSGGTLDLQPIEAVASGHLDKPVILGTNLSEGLVFAQQVSSSLPFPVPLPLLLIGFFGQPRAAAISQIERYSVGEGGDIVPPLGRIFSDYLFTCANQFFAKNADNVYAYQFNQTSPMYALADLTCPARPCPPSPSSCLETVCHAAELPFVFHSTGLFDDDCGSGFDQPCWTTELTALSQTMSQAWVRFAAQESPGSSWPSFSPSSTYRLFSTDTQVTTGSPVQAQTSPSSGLPLGPSTTPVDCSFWDNLVTGPGTQPWYSYDIEDPSTPTGQPPPPDIYMEDREHQTVTTCRGSFYSTNYPESYPQIEVGTVTILPSSSDLKVTLDFTAFETASEFDHLILYNGSNTTDSDNVIGTYQLNESPGIVKSSADDGALTAYFTSMPSYPRTGRGWQATISCSP